ncbi:flagellar assembly protein FliX [Sphingomonas sp. TDK1]|uniref:flagellar assembly protein FliX n=1 Tax=Sphingomonas sp. TDK1 TaxID=453247 RepID=UPI0007DA3EC6|nr:flagellar assembly protein FliX [Sphingomonas sp. TDK1]OAN57283.1 flagellar trans-acting factor FliX [Sphingomonas sp. TDK1]
MRIDSLSPMMARNLLAALPKSVPSLTSRIEGQTSAPAQPLAAPPTVSPTSVQMLVAIAANNPVAERRRKQARDVERGIDALDRLHKELVAGTPNVARLREIVEWSQAVPTPTDPGLAALMRDIDLRVQVELAKLDIRV